MITPKTSAQIDLMKKAGNITARLLDKISKAAQPGTTTKELNALANDLCRQYKVRPAFLGYNGYPASICTSVNSTVVHGIPDSIPLKNGDILGLDMGVVYRGYCSDSAITIPIGKVSDEATKLIAATKEALGTAIKTLKDGVTTGDIGYIISQIAKKNGFCVVNDLSGHGIGRKLQEEPSVPNFGKKGAGIVLKENYTIAIEPMFALKCKEISVAPDNWAIYTKDKSLAAHFEHTVQITKNGCQILSVR